METVLIWISISPNAYLYTRVQDNYRRISLYVRVVVVDDNAVGAETFLMRVVLILRCGWVEIPLGVCGTGWKLHPVDVCQSNSLLILCGCMFRICQGLRWHDSGIARPTVH